MKPRVLDLFCGAGGASAGYHHAGFEVVGVDVVPQPDYPFDFIQADALDCTRFTFQGFSLTHASPPCQFEAAISKGTNARLRHTYPDLIDPVRKMLERSGVPYIIENPASRPDVVLCGEMFDLKVIRHRRFELGGWSAQAPQHRPHRGRVAGMRHGEWFEGPYFAVYGNGGGKGTVAQWQDAMDIHWTGVRKSIAEAIPPAYTEHIGRQFISHLKKEAA
jgi:hypothetical protein